MKPSSTGPKPLCSTPWRVNLWKGIKTPNVQTFRNAPTFGAMVFQAFVKVPRNILNCESTQEMGLGSMVPYFFQRMKAELAEAKDFKPM